MVQNSQGARNAKLVGDQLNCLARVEWVTQTGEESVARSEPADLRGARHTVCIARLRACPRAPVPARQCGWLSGSDDLRAPKWVVQIGSTHPYRNLDARRSHGEGAHRVHASERRGPQILRRTKRRTPRGTASSHDRSGLQTRRMEAAGRHRRQSFRQGDVLREAIFYSGDSAYSFQYRDFAPKKYGRDDAWLETHKGFLSRRLGKSPTPWDGSRMRSYRVS